MVEADKTGIALGVVATRTVSGGIAGFDNTLIVREDGTLRFSERRFGRDETRRVAPERVRELRDVLYGPEWQGIAGFYGSPVPDGMQTVIEGGGRRTVLEDGPGFLEKPPIIREVLGLLDGLWADGGVEPPASPQPNFFDLGGDGVEVAYGVIRARGEFLDYSDAERSVSLSARNGDDIESRESRIGTMITVDLNREEVLADAALITLTLLIPRFKLDGSGTAFRTVAIRTTHLATGLRPEPPQGKLQSYEPLRLEGTAGHAD